MVKGGPIMNKLSLMILSFMLLILLTGCDSVLDNAAATSATPTIVPLPAITATPDIPTPTALPLSLPSPTPVPATSTLTPPSPTSAAAVVTPPVTVGPLTGATEANTTLVTGASLSGAWDFSFGTISLTQRDSNLEGTYQWYGGADTGQIKGVIVAELNQFQGLWISDGSPNNQRLLRWQLAGDGNSFSGATEGGSTSQQWCGVRSGQPLPAGCGFSGVWQLRFGSPAGVTGQATLVQTGQTVQGTYVDSQGHTGEIVDGVVTVQSVTEATLTGTWRNEWDEQDSFEWRLDLTTGRTFQGRRNPGNSEWCGWREGISEPEACGW